MAFQSFEDGTTGQFVDNTTNYTFENNTDRAQDGTNSVRIKSTSSGTGEESATRDYDVTDLSEITLYVATSTSLGLADGGPCQSCSGSNDGIWTEIIFDGTEVFDTADSSNSDDSWNKVTIDVSGMTGTKTLELQHNDTDDSNNGSSYLDAITTKALYNTNVTESFTASDSLIEKSDLFRNLTQGLNTSDSFNKSVEFLRDFNETFSPTDDGVSDFSIAPRFFNKRKTLSVSSQNDSGQTVNEVEPAILSGQTFYREIDGFEDGDFSSSPQWTTSSVDVDISVQNSFAFNGDFAVEMQGSGGENRLIHDRGSQDSLEKDHVYQSWVYTENSSDSEFVGFALSNSSGDTDLLRLGIRRGEFQFANLNRSDFKTFGTANSNNWYRFELEIFPEASIDFTQGSAEGRVYDVNNNLIDSKTVGLDTLTSQYVHMVQNSGATFNVYFDDVSYSTAPGTKVFEGDGKTGTGELIVEYTDITGEDDIAFFDEQGYLIPYEVESLDTSGSAVAWVSSDWVRDDTEQAQVGYGGNESTASAGKTSGVWKGSSVEMVQHFEESPLTASDSSPNGYNGSVNGASSISDGQFNSAASFSGTDNIEFSGSNLLSDAGDKGTVSLWVRFDEVSSTYYIFDSDTSGSNRYSLLYDGNNSRYEFIVNGTKVKEFNKTPYTGLWYNLVVTWDTVNDNYNLYEGTELKGVDVNNASAANPDNFYIGSDYTNSNNLVGDVDEFKVFNEVKQDSFVQAEFDSAAFNKTTGKTGFHKYPEIDGFEDGDYSDKWSTGSGSAFEVQSTTVSNGSFSLEASTNAGTTNVLSLSNDTVAPDKLQTYIRANSLSGVENTKVEWRRNGNIICRIRLHDGSLVANNQPVISASADTWYFVELIIDYGSNAVDIYVDGTQEYTGQPFINDASGFDETQIRMEKSSTGDSNTLVGYFDDVSLTSAEGSGGGQLFFSQSEPLITESISDSLNVADNALKQFITGFSESLGLNDTVFSKPNISLNPSISLTESFSDEASFTRLPVETVSLSETGSLQFETSLFENSQVSDSSSKSFFKALADSTSLTSDTTKFAGLNQSQSVDLNDSSSKFVSKDYFESVDINDSTKSKILKVLEQSLSLADAYVLGLIFSETVTVDESIEKQLEKPLTDSFVVSESEKKQVSKKLNDSVNVADAVEFAASLFRNYSEQISLTDANVEEFVSLLLSDSVQTVDDVDTSAELFREFSDSLGLTDSDLKQIGEKLGETVDADTSTDEEIRKQVVQQIVLSGNTEKALFTALSESLKISDEIDSNATFFNSQTVSISVLDSQSSQLQKSLNEVNTLNDSLLREIDLNLDEVFNPQASAEVRRLAGQVADEVEIESLQKALAKVEYLKRAYVED